MRVTALVAAGLLAAVVVSGCSSVSEARKIDYRNTTTLPTLEVPPDLANVPDANLPEGRDTATTYSGYAGEQRTQAPGTVAVLPQYPDVKLVREGQTRFIIVKAEPAAVWDEVRDFLTRTGLSIAKENPKAGIIETGWAENRALVGAANSNSVVKWLKSFYSTGARDKYRVRLERGVTPGTTEIYLTHQGMQEIGPSENGGARAGWEPRPPDPELEAEMLHRLVVHLGGGRGSATVVAEAKPVKSSPSASVQQPERPLNAHLTNNGNGTPLLSLQDSLDRAWRRVGLSLDRIGFTVEDRDRSKGIYYVRYVDPELREEQKGFFSRLFGNDEPVERIQYQVHVKPAEKGTSVEVLNEEGGPAASRTGERILSLLYEQLK